MRLAGKRCLVTAAAQGIGEATARAFAEEGAEVWATDINEGKLAALANLRGIKTSRLDVLRDEEISQIGKRVGPIDVLFNCAGFVHHGTVLDATDEEWRFAFDLNVRSMFWTIRTFLPGMLASGKGGSIINVASAASSIKGAPLRFVYGSTKAALRKAKIRLSITSTAQSEISRPMKRSAIQAPVALTAQATRLIRNPAMTRRRWR